MKKSILALILSLLNSAYFILMLLILLFSLKVMNETNGNTPAAPFVFGLVFIVMLPHTILVILSLIFSWVGYGTNKTGFILTQAILTTIGILLWLPTWFLTLPVAIFGYVTYGFMINAKKKFELEKTKTVVSNS
ncbi:MAG: hypothetical protein HGB31_02500 [Erysipelotrichaceae bacterium]|nr:hypothetical protein [Erysipelotrichaceae bacterium]